jgi:alkanesulfonate monooxygenase SsuD/methylene tetrahydromethanopterin reductase-like flavin-dependent oxidoreductase (luciferase family)
MRFGLLQEGHTPDGVTAAQRYHEMIEEAVLAEQVGFDFYCLPEQHFLEKIATVSAPELLFAAIAGRTSTLRLRFTSAVLLTFNHPVRIAERVATLDILSNGRVEVGTARSNNLNTLQAFGVDPKTTRQQWEESLQVLQAALSSSPFSHDGELWQIPERPLVPPPVQQPHPPFFVSATSVETHKRAGQLGIGVMNGNNILGWDYMQGCIDAYREGIAEAREAGRPLQNESVAISVLTAHCDEDEERAKREAADVAFYFIEIVLGMYASLSEASPDYAYLGRIKEIQERSRDLDFLISLAPYISIGTPEFLIDRFRDLQSRGADEVLLRIDGMGHDVNMRAIETIGRHVIPALR